MTPILGAEVQRAANWLKAENQDRGEKRAPSSASQVRNIPGTKSRKSSEFPREQNSFKHSRYCRVWWSIALESDAPELEPQALRPADMHAIGTQSVTVITFTAFTVIHPCPVHGDSPNQTL